MDPSALPTQVAHSSVYRGRRIVVRSSGVPQYAWAAFVDGWPVSNRRRGDPGGFPAVDQAVGRCKVVIDQEMPARRWRVLHRLLRRARTALNKALTGDRRRGATPAPIPVPVPRLSGSTGASRRARRAAPEGPQPWRPPA